MVRQEQYEIFTAILALMLNPSYKKLICLTRLTPVRSQKKGYLLKERLLFFTLFSLLADTLEKLWNGQNRSAQNRILKEVELLSKAVRSTEGER